MQERDSVMMAYKDDFIDSVLDPLREATDFYSDDKITYLLVDIIDNLRKEKRHLRTKNEYAEDKISTLIYEKNRLNMFLNWSLFGYFIVIMLFWLSCR